MQQPSLSLRGGTAAVLLAASMTACTFTQTEVVNPTGPTAADNCARLQATLATITDNAADKPYLIKLEPGIYDCGATEVVMKEHIDIEGSGQGITEITGTGASPTDVVHMASHTELRNLSVTNLSTPGGSVTIAVHALNVSDARISEVTASVLNAGGGTAQAIRFVGSGQLDIESVHAFVDSPAQTNCGVAVQGVPTPGGNLRLSNVVAETKNGTFQSNGICEQTPSQQLMDVDVRNSVLIGSTFSVNDPGGHVRIAHSQLIGPAGGAAGPKCINAYNETYDALGADCN